ncbi:ABC transporter substrate-binding protein [Lacrimispora algidixylanolytica]|uniref:Metal ABC transporter substrate-binding protein n=1 Tax=Lacrimispora algidixylanolytica TaxID=94868 RepID=A0A419T1K4_9FIRM|nr:ABC transporter substrate-binding protein [Lacrimispora algidixylanolytica]RKD31355.1 metal ABC transporter substrate-binding protein [Lacrimispora algidixylanolytica]
MKRIIPFVLTLILITGFITGCANNIVISQGTDVPTQEVKNTSEKKTIKIAYLPITHALPVFREKELFEKESSNIEIELIKYGSWPELLDALNTNRVDGASVLIELAMKSKEEGNDIKAVALGHHDGNVIIVSNDISSPEDLKGKKFAIPHRQSSHNILLNEMLNQAGISLRELEIVELAPPEMPSALASGQIAGYCVAEPFGAKAVDLGVGKVLYDSTDLWRDSICCALVMTDKFLNENSDTVNQFIASYKEAGNQLNNEEAEKISKEYLGQEKDVLDISLKWISYNDLDITEETYSALIDKVKKYGLSDNPPSFEEFVYKP